MQIEEILTKIILGTVSEDDFFAVAKTSASIAEGIIKNASLLQDFNLSVEPGPDPYDDSFIRIFRGANVTAQNCTEENKYIFLYYNYGERYSVMLY